MSAFFSTEGNTSDMDPAVAEPTAAEAALHSHDGPAGESSTGEAPAGGDRIEVSREALDALLSASAGAIRALDADGWAETAKGLRAAIAKITGGKGTWRATAGRSHCVVTGTWLDARELAAERMGAPVAAVTLRRVAPRSHDTHARVA